jgi:hypothetical protein
MFLRSTACDTIYYLLAIWFGPELSSLVFGLTDLSHFGRCFGQNKAVSVFNGSVVCFNVGIGLTFLGRSCSTRHELSFQLF